MHRWNRIDQELSILGRVIVSALDETAKPDLLFPDKARQTPVLVFTSGTTGEPKGVRLSHQALIYMGANIWAWLCKKLRRPWQGGNRCLTMYLVTD